MNRARGARARGFTLFSVIILAEFLSRERSDRRKNAERLTFKKIKSKKVTKC